MKKIGDILSLKKTGAKTKLDEKSVYYFFNKVIEKEYGNKGLGSLKPDYYRSGKLFVKSRSSVWANELWMNRGEIVDKINQEIGSKEVCEIKIKS